jgi:hypothetical protein
LLIYIYIYLYVRVTCKKHPRSSGVTCSAPPMAKNGQPLCHQNIKWQQILWRSPGTVICNGLAAVKLFSPLFFSLFLLRIRVGPTKIKFCPPIVFLFQLYFLFFLLLFIFLIIDLFFLILSLSI